MMEANCLDKSLELAAEVPTSVLWHLDAERMRLTEANNSLDDFRGRLEEA
jgi:hypothetical protein